MCEEESEELPARVTRCTCDRYLDCHTHEYASRCNLLHTRSVGEPRVQPGAGPITSTSRLCPDLPWRTAETLLPQVDRTAHATPLIEAGRADAAPGTLDGVGETATQLRLGAL